jgi:hypothetical protein
MFIKVRNNKNNIELYRETKVAIFILAFTAFLFLLFGITFSWLSQKNTSMAIAFLPFGILFGVIGLFLVNASIKQLTKLKKTNGFILFQADFKGLSLTPNLGMETTNYNWDEISRIVLTKEITNNSSNSTRRRKSYSTILVCFKNIGNLNLMERSKQQIWETPKGVDYMALDLSKNRHSEIQQKITSLSKNAVKAELYKSVFFTYDKSEETYNL